MTCKPAPVLQPRNLPGTLSSFIRHRTKIAQEIARTREHIAAVRLQIRDLEGVQEDLAAVDRTLGLHDIQIDPHDIKPLSNKYKRINLRYGELSLCVFAAIRSNGGGPTPRRLIYEYICAKYPHLVRNDASIKLLKQSLHDRLKGLGWQGRLVRHHENQGPHDGIWSFPSRN